MTSALVDAQTRALVETVAAAEKIVRDEETAILALIQSAAADRALARVRKLREAVAQLQLSVNDNGRVWLQQTLPVAYAEGAAAALFDVGGPEFVWSQNHVDAMSRLVTDTYDDILAASREAGRTSTQFASRVKAAARVISAGNVAGKTTAETSRAAARTLQEQGFTGVTYKDGARHGVSDYMDMLARTKVASAYNEAALSEYDGEGVKYLEIHDGFGCGLESHDSPTKADGMIVGIDVAQSYPISHPRCRRAFSARQDVNTDREAKAARQTATPAQIADNAANDATRHRVSLSRRDAVLAKHGLVPA